MSSFSRMSSLSNISNKFNFKQPSLYNMFLRFVLDTQRIDFKYQTKNGTLNHVHGYIFKNTSKLNNKNFRDLNNETIKNYFENLNNQSPYQKSDIDALEKELREMYQKTGGELIKFDLKVEKSTRIAPYIIGYMFFLCTGGAIVQALDQIYSKL